MSDEDTPMETGAAAPDAPLPSIHRDETLAGDSYMHFSPVPPALASSASPAATKEPCVLGVDEAGRGPVLGPMVYGVFYLPQSQSTPLLKTTYHFDDSKVLTPAVRASLMRTLCTPGTPLHDSCGWAISSLSARDIGAHMLQPASRAAYNLNAQAQDATTSLIQGVLDRGVNVAEIYVDTVGPPATYQARLERIFPNIKITVAKKADSLYPCVSAASVCAKVTRDVALETLYEARAAGNKASAAEAAAAAAQGQEQDQEDEDAAAAEEKEDMAWGSGYPSDARCVTWLRRNMHPVFGWGPECRFSWGTARDMIESKSNGAVRIEWPADDEDADPGTSRMTDFFAAESDEPEVDELGTWFGTPATAQAF